MTKNEEPKPHLRLASQNDQLSLDRRYQVDRVRWCLKELTANLLRITRGAGKPQAVPTQCIEVIKAFQEYHTAVGTWPHPNDINEAISLRGRKLVGLNEQAQEWEEALNTMMFGSLQIAASKLLQQNTQEAAGQRQLFEGLEVIEARRAANVRKRSPKGKK